MEELEAIEYLKGGKAQSERDLVTELSHRLSNEK